MDEQIPHRLTLDRRSRLTVSGVEEVASFDETSIRMTTRAGVLLVRGDGLHIEKLSLDGGDLLVEGAVDALIYEEVQEPVSLLSRLFRG
jgi:sporulation protein YabP